MNAVRVILGLVMVTGLTACKRDEPIGAEIFVQDADARNEIPLGRPMRGAIRCAAPMIFTVTPVDGAKAKFELKIAKGAPKTCYRLNARSAQFKPLKPTVTVCSDDPEKFASADAPFGSDVSVFTIDPQDTLQTCVSADYRITLTK